MKKISEFIINKVSRREENVIELIADVDDEAQCFVIIINKSNENMLAEFSKDLEFLLRSNDANLSKNLLKFLKKIVHDERLNLPFDLFSESSSSRNARPRQPQAA